MDHDFQKCVGYCGVLYIHERKSFWHTPGRPLLSGHIVSVKGDLRQVDTELKRESKQKI